MISVCSWKPGPEVEFVLHFECESPPLWIWEMCQELKGHQQAFRLSSDLNYSLRTFLNLTCFTAQKPSVIWPQWKFLSPIFFILIFWFREIKTFQECILLNLPLTNVNIKKILCDWLWHILKIILCNLETGMISHFSKTFNLIYCHLNKIVLNSNQITLISGFQGISQEPFFFICYIKTNK